MNFWTYPGSTWEYSPDANPSWSARWTDGPGDSFADGVTTSWSVTLSEAEGSAAATADGETTSWSVTLSEAEGAASAIPGTAADGETTSWSVTLSEAEGTAIVSTTADGETTEWSFTLSEPTGATAAARSDMGLRLTVYAPTLTRPIILYETGQSNSRLYERGVGSVARRVDLYTGRDAMASSGTIRTTLDNRDGLFSADGLFAPRWRDVTLVAEINNEVVFVGRAERISEGVAGIKVDIHWRDLVDDFLAQQIEGVPGELNGARILASTTTRSILGQLGIDATAVPDIDLWLPERTTTIRRWLLPAMAALSYTFDWEATASATGITSNVVMRSESEFGNQNELPLFTDKHLIGDPKWDDGRQQVFNLWQGERRFWDPVESRFDTERLTAFGDTRRQSAPHVSRETFGDRKVRLDVSQFRVDRTTLLGYVNDIIKARSRPHVRGTMTLRGTEASALRIGDGFRTGFNFATRVGRGLHRCWRVQGRTVDLLTETTTLYAEVRDGADADYQAWIVSGANVTEAAAP